MSMNYLSYTPQTKSQNNLVLERHTFFCSFDCLCCICKSCGDNHDKIQLNWSKFHSIITMVCKWYQGEQGAALHEYGEQDGHEVDLHEYASHDNDSITTDNDSVDQE